MKNQTTTDRRLLENSDQLPVYQPVARSKRRPINVQFRAIKIRNLAACLFDKQRSCGNVPGIQALFPKALVTSTGNIREVYCGGSVAANATREHKELVQMACRLLAVPYVIGKTSYEQRIVKLVYRRDAYRLAVHRRSSAGLRRKKLIAGRVVSYADDD